MDASHQLSISRDITDDGQADALHTMLVDTFPACCEASRGRNGGAEVPYSRRIFSI